MLNIEEDILMLLDKDIPYSLRVNIPYGEYTCRSIVKSINDANMLGSKSFNSVLKDEENLSFAKKILYMDKKEVSMDNIKSILRKGGGFPTNFKPSLAKSIYSRFCKEGDTCLDYSAGFGGRLLGCLCTGKNLRYIGFEPNTKTSKELNELGSKVSKVIKDSSSFRIIKDVSENICHYIDCDSIDIAFSCPPYYKYEEYCLEETQSIVKYPIYNDWLNGYVLETIKGIYKALKTNGFFLVYLMNVKIEGVYYNLIDDWVHIAEKVGFSIIGYDVVNKDFSIAGKSCLVILRK